MKSKFTYITLLLILVNTVIAKPVNELLPWVNIPDKIELGMTLDDLLKIDPNLSDLNGKAGGDGLYFSQFKNDDGSLFMCSIEGGVLTHLLWGTEKEVSIERIKKIRTALHKIDNSPRIGYIPRMTLENIAKVTTEIYKVSDDNSLVISFIAAFDKIEVSLIRIKNENELQEMYFSYEKVKKTMIEDAKKQTNIVMKDEDPSNYTDVLLTLIEANSSPNDFKEKSKLKQDEENKKSKIKGDVETKNENNNNFLWIVIGSLGIAFLGFLVLKNRGRKS